jgi:pilus assembly protein FimV
MTRPSLPATGVSSARPISALASRCQLSLLSVAVAVALGALGSNAHALALGRLNVQSALGEPLRAEIDVTEISAAEADGLKVGMASREAFQAAGVAYNDALSNVRAALQRRADGRYVVRLTGSRPMSEPFVDILLEASWSSGRIVRDYTVLLDPPSSRPASAAVPIAPVAPQISAPAPAPRVAVAPSGESGTAAPRRQRPAAVPAAPLPAESRVRAEGGGEQQVTVRAGDTAGRLAASLKPADVSLDQMLVALLRANPDAFINGNVNRIKAGAVLQVPSASTATAMPPDEARRTVVAQSRDFGDYRRRLAENAPTSRVASADRQASGRLQANVEDRNANAASPDKLTVSQGTAARAAEEKLAQTRQAQESSTRVAELSRNINELNKIQNAGTGAAPAAAATPPAPAPAPATAPAAPAAAAAGAAPAATAPAAMPAPAAAAPAAPSAAAPAPAATAAAPTAAPAASPAAAVSGTPAASAAPTTPAAAAPAPAPAAKPKVVAAPPPPEPGLFDQLMENPILLAGGALILLLIGFLLYRVLGRKKQDAADSVFPESRLPKDSFFGATGGESVDTKGRSSSMVSSLSYSPSQLDAGDVDPVAEADVYLAYGRDLQAEEILREALRTTPERTAIHLKLLEIHAKRRDLRAFEALANDVHKLTGGSGAEWGRVIDMGRELDPGNPLYQGSAALADNEKTVPLAGVATAAAIAAMAPPPPAEPPPPFVPSVAPLDFDLDLAKPSDVAPLPDTAPAPITAPATVYSAAPGASYEPTARAPLDGASASLQGAPAKPSYESSLRSPMSRGAVPDLDNDFDTAPAELDALPRDGALNDDEHTQPATLRAGLPGDSGFIEFDMSTLSSLRSGTGDTRPGALEPTRTAELDDGAGDSPQAVKLSLARELQALGDAEGARSLVEEVASESSGEMRHQAEQLLAQLR